MSNRERTPALVGLTVAWGGTALVVSPAASVLGDPGSILTKCLEQCVLWLLFGVILGIVLLWERQPLSSLWLRHFRWESVAWGGFLAVVSILLLFPATEWLRISLGLGRYAAGMKEALALPAWLRVTAVIMAGIVEETLFRGYAVTRLAWLTGSLWLAGVLAAMIFAGLHLPSWGRGPAAAFLIVSIATNAFFIWRRDLLATIIGHLAIDTWAIMIAPTLSEWWK